MAIETLAFGYGLVEAPRYANGGLYFSDCGEGGVFHHTDDGGVQEVIPVGRLVGGIAMHADGGFVFSSKDLFHWKDGQERLVFSCENEGPRNGDWQPWFNDIYADHEGRVYAGALWRLHTRAAAAPGNYVKPTGGEGEAYREDKPLGRLWRISGQDTGEALYGGVGIANGIGLSPDGRTLYQVDSIDQRVIVTDVEGDAVARRPDMSTTASAGFPDGMAVDEKGRIWAAMFNGRCAACFAPDGTLETTVPVPADAVTSLCFGGDDMRDLYIVSADNTDDPSRRGTVFRIRVDVPGLPAPLARV